MMAETERFRCIHRSFMTKGELTREKIIEAPPPISNQHGYESQKV